jgi:hypothetical protein
MAGHETSCEVDDSGGACATRGRRRHRWCRQIRSRGYWVLTVLTKHMMLGKGYLATVDIQSNARDPKFSDLQK